MNDIQATFELLEVGALSYAKCSDIAVTSAASEMHFSWCGKICDMYEGLRYATTTDEYAVGFLFTKYFGSFLTALETTSFYEDCSPFIDNFIQSYATIAYGTSDYTVYNTKLNRTEGSVFFEGALLVEEQVSTYDVDHSKILLADEEYKLLGPKIPIYYGLEGAATYVVYFNSTTELEGTWEAEPSGIFDVQETMVVKGLDPNTLMFDASLEDRTSEHTLFSINSADLHTSFPAVCEIDDEHVVVIKLIDIGSAFEVYAALYKFNFTTKVLDLVEEHLLWNTEPNPVEFVFSNNRVTFASGWGTNGVLCVSQPNYSGIKSNDGRIHKLAWNGTNFTVLTALEFGNRVGYAGTCIGYDSISNRLVFGQFSDDIYTCSETGALGPFIEGARDSRWGELFSVAAGRMQLWSADTRQPRLYTISTSAITYVDSLGTSTYDCSTFVHAGVHRPTGRFGDEYPVLILISSDAAHWMTLYVDANLDQAYTTAGSPIFTYGRSSKNSVIKLGWQSNYAKYRYSGTAQWTYWSSDNIISDTVSMYLSHVICAAFYDGVDEYFAYFFVSVDQLRTNYNIVKLTETAKSHVQLGYHYLKSYFNVASSSSITSTAASWYNLSSSYGTTCVFFIQKDNDPLYYTVDSSGTLIPYATLEEVKAAALSIGYWASYGKLIDISSINDLYVYIALGKTLSYFYPTQAPGITSVTLSVQVTGLAEPELCLHFGDTERIKAVRKSTADEILFTTADVPLAAGANLITTGGRFKRLQ